MIKHISIRNFKSIEHSKIDLKRINILVGGNNSGKTSILQAIQFGCSIVQTINIAAPIPWGKNEHYTRSIEPTELVYSPLKDVSALSRGGELKQGEKYTITLSYQDEDNNICNVTVKRGKNRNIVATINKSELTTTFTSITEPVCMFVPGLAGIPYNEEFKSESIIRKAAAKGDANSVLRNILWLLNQDKDKWASFIAELRSIFPSISIEVEFNPQTDEYINVKIIETTEAINDNSIPIPIKKHYPLMLLVQAYYKQYKYYHI